MKAYPVKDFSSWPLSGPVDRITVWFTMADFRGDSVRAFTVCVDSNGQTHEVGRYDGASWLWCRGLGFVPWQELLPGTVASDAEALCLCTFRHSGEFCRSQAFSDFDQAHAHPFWQDVIRRVEPLFPIAFVLFE